MLSSINKVPEPKHILLLGPPGGGKTTFALQFPKPYIADCDQNLDGPKAWLERQRKGFAFSYDTIAYDDSGNEVPVQDRWERLLLVSDAALRSPDIHTVIYDSLTHIDEYLLRFILKRQNQPEMRRQDWIPFRSELIQFLMRSRRSSKTVIMTCHEEIILTDKGTVDKYTPAIRSKISDYFGSMFTDAYRCTAQVVGGKPEFSLQLFKDSMSPDLKNTILAPAAPMKATFEEWNKYAKLPLP